LSESNEASLKRLADLKAYLQKRLGEHEEEVKTLRSFMEVVDSLLAEKSYRRMELPKQSNGQALARQQEEQPGQSIRTISGVLLADVKVQGQDLRIVPSEKMRFDVNSPPLKSFLLAKVLEPMQTRDVEAAHKGELSPDKVLSFNVDQEGTVLKEVHVKNYGDERRLNEIRNAVRWTFRRMYEKTIGT
jgi:hypothetical protein